MFKTISHSFHIFPMYTLSCNLLKELFSRSSEVLLTISYGLWLLYHKVFCTKSIKIADVEKFIYTIFTSFVSWNIVGLKCSECRLGLLHDKVAV